MSTNVPIADGPVGGTNQFFGRQQLLRRVSHGLRKRISYLLCGGPKSGKTSVLAQIKHNEEKRWKSGFKGTKIVPVYLDLAAIAQLTPERVCGAIYDVVYQEVNRPIVRCEIVLNREPFKKMSSGADSWQILSQHLKNMWKQLQGSSGYCEYTLLLDNADALLTGHDCTSLSGLAAFLVAGGPSVPQATILSGGRDLRLYSLDPSSAFQGMFRPILLGSLSTPDSTKMVRGWLPTAAERSIAQLSAMSGGHPFVLAKMIGDILKHDLMNDLRSVFDNAAFHCEGLFEALWNEFDLGRGISYRGAYAAPEHALMQLLIELGSQGCRSRDAERELGIRPLKEYSEFLELLGVIERITREDYYILRGHFQLWNTWYSERIIR